MNAKTIFFTLLLVTLVSCKKDSTNAIVDPPVVPNDPPVVSIAVGNIYNIWYVNISGIIAIDWGQHTSVLRDTTIGGNKYFVFSSGEIIRSTATSVVQWNGSSEITLYRFNVKVGDSISYQGHQLKITSITIDTVFVGTQTIVEASNVGTTSDTTMTITFAKKFGLLTTRKSLPNKAWNISLIGAKLDTTKYGSL
jgi:hypothetical protein